MTKGDYCIKKKIHFCYPNFDENEEADEEFRKDIDEICNILREGDKEMKKKRIKNGILWLFYYVSWLWCFIGLCVDPDRSNMIAWAVFYVVSISYLVIFYKANRRLLNV